MIKNYSRKKIRTIIAVEKQLQWRIDSLSYLKLKMNMKKFLGFLILLISKSLQLKISKEEWVNVKVNS